MKLPGILITTIVKLQLRKLIVFCNFYKHNFKAIMQLNSFISGIYQLPITSIQYTLYTISYTHTFESYIAHYTLRL